MNINKEEKPEKEDKKKEQEEMSEEKKEKSEGYRRTGIKSGRGRRRRETPEERETREREEQKEKLASWVPKTKLGLLVKSGKIKNVDEVLEKYRVLEPEIIDSLLELRSDLINIGQAKGKFGGGKRRVWRQTQKKSSEGNIPTFSAIATVGDSNGHVGIGMGKSKETLPAREKALRKAKLNLISVKRGCGSFDCSCIEKHSILFRVEGKCGSSRIVLMPAPQGTGLVIGDECKKILKLAGIRDIYSKTFGQTRTTINLVKACINALEKTTKIK